MPEVIRCDSVWKIYNKGSPNEVDALRGVDLKVKEGDFLAIVGASGSGKSTLLHIIGALDVPTRGKVFIEGQDLTKLNDNKLAMIRRKKLGFIFQSFNLVKSMTTLENVELPMIFNGIGKEERIEKARDLLHKVELGDKINQKPSKLSGGQSQRVAIARALANNPSVILADEPTGNLDTKSGQHIIDIFKKLNKDGRTIVIITHDPRVAKQAERIVTISDGMIKNG
jgi:putative ABC transport system ATP-binding protein